MRHGGHLGFWRDRRGTGPTAAPLSPGRVLYAKRRQLPSSVEEELGLVYASQDELVAASDFLCSLLPYYPETDHVLNAALLARMKPGSFVVHCGSGSVIDEAALAAAIQQGHLAGVALDTFEWEPIRPDNPLLPLARDPAMNVLLTPHTAAGAPRRNGERDATSRKEEYTNILRFIRGKPLRYRLV